ncbi:urea transporter 2 [Danio rerio]|uniref:Facilitated urea transporter n=2 Tax=Danio rerio TaxID=7955 RepID=Q533H0_DANRE|nr:urea transporter 2 [Danio rerio]AAI15204.1 Zgc:136632 [Danio rerio]AAX16119.1 facilitated urea transporter [Danio rerio]|eukprot:NP_001018355.1 urea transporter 1 [Danio rerio]
MPGTHLTKKSDPLNVTHLCKTSTSTQYSSAQNTKELQPLMANPVHKITDEKKQQGLEKINSGQRFKANLIKWVSFISGDMAAFGEWMKGQFILLQIMDWVLRGAAQVMFVNNPLSGLIIFAGLILQNRWWALNGFVGTVFATISALILCQNRGAIAAGLYGYNGILVGLLMAVFSNAGDWYWWLLLPNIFMSMACPIVSSALASINSRWDLPVFTLPFNILVCLHMVATGHYNQYFPQILIQPTTSMSNLTWSELDYAQLFRSIPVGIGQVYGCDNAWTGGIFMIALFISSPITFAHATIGSAVGMVSGLALAAPFKNIYMGLWGYNCVLACIAIGGMFYALTWQTHLLAVACAFFCAYLGSAIGNVMSNFGLPACTWPFCLSALTFLLITTETKFIHKLPLAKVAYPEQNLRYYWKMKKEEKTQKGIQAKDTESQLEKEQISISMEKKDLDICTVDVQQEENTL